MSSAVLHVPATRETVLFGRPHVRDLNPAAVSAGISAFIFYVAAPVPLLIAVAGRLGLDAAHTSSWFFIVFASTAVTSIVLSLVYRQPLPFNWSLPGLLYLGSLAGHYSYPELVGANVMAGASDSAHRAAQDRPSARGRAAAADRDEHVRRRRRRQPERGGHGGRRRSPGRGRNRGRLSGRPTDPTT